MSIFDNINSRKQSINDEITNEKGLADLIESGISVALGQGITSNFTQRNSLEHNTGWVYACVDAIANEIGNIELKLLKQDGKGSKEILEHPLLDLLYRANNVTTKFDLFSMTQKYLELVGEAPWYILKDKRNVPVQIILLRGDRLTVLPGTNNDLIGGYLYKVNGNGGYKEIKLEVDDIVFLKNPNPSIPFRGKGTLSAVMDTFELDERAELYNKNLFDNSATPSLILSTDKKLSRDIMDRLKSEVERKYTGTRNAHKTMILEGGMKAEKLSMSNAEMQFIEQQRMSRDKILAIFRVPRTVLGITDDVNRANAEASDYVFAKRTIRPKMQRLIEQLNEFLVPMFDDTGSLYLDYVNPIPESEADNLAKANGGITQRYITPNEARAFINLPPIVGGDELPATPMPFVNTTPTEPTKGNETIRKVAVLKYQQYTKKVKRFKAIEQGIADTVTPIIYASLQMKYNKKKKKEVIKKTDKKKLFENEEGKLKFQGKQLEVSDTYETNTIKALNTIFNQQAKIMIDSLPSEGTIKLSNIALDVKKQKQVYLDKLTTIMSGLIAEQSAIANRLIGIDPNKKAYKEKITRFSEATQDYIARKIGQMALAVTKETNSRLKGEIKDGIEQEESIPQIEQRIRSVYNDMKAVRSKVIARTEVSRATNFASLETYKDSGLVEGQEWLASLDERTDECCASLNGKIINLDDNWFDKGDSYLGLSLDYENVEHPPLHPNCRCTLIPVLK